MRNLEHIGDILPRVLSHIWGQTRFEYGNVVHRCPCGVIRRQFEDRTEYWRWRNGKLERMALPPPHQEPDAA
jgi:hypothetical protein